tara:strand:+ start:75 stop:305 length:231 start_codon:yes stop_codon:yes gene_type:complete
MIPSQLAQLISKITYSYKEVLIVGPEAQKFSEELQKNYLPNVIFQISNRSSDLPLVKDRCVKDKTLVYLYVNIKFV